MENKYYTPDIQDIRIGYECEYSAFIGGLNNQVLDEVINVKLDKDQVKSIISQGNIENLVRTKYLDREDIESEEWIFDYKLCGNDNCTFYEQVFKKDTDLVNYRLSFSSEGYVTISGWFHDNSSTPTTKTLFRGNIPSINELRTIQKLLGI